MLEFNEETHQYKWDSNPVPSVTQVIRSAAFVDTSFYTEDGRERGTYVHRAVELWNQGRLDMDTVDDEIFGYLEGWQKYISDFGMQPVETEKRVYNETYRYAGTLDYIGISESGRRYLIDIKTGGANKTHAMQLAAYRECVDNIDYVRTVYLSADGKYKAPTVKLTDEWQVFVCALTCFNWKGRK